MREDCFGYYKDAAVRRCCTVIRKEEFTEEYCEQQCPFYKTNKQLAEEKQKAEARLKKVFGVAIK